MPTHSFRKNAGRHFLLQEYDSFKPFDSYVPCVYGILMKAFN